MGERQARVLPPVVGKSNAAVATLKPAALLKSRQRSGYGRIRRVTLTGREIFLKVFNTIERCVIRCTAFGENNLAMVTVLATLHVVDIASDLLRTWHEWALCCWSGCADCNTGTGSLLRCAGKDCSWPCVSANRAR